MSNNWKKHNSYPPGVSTSRTVTRSQTGFNRINHTLSELELFADQTRHKPPNHPHLMVIMKGEFGSIPNTIVTRSTGKKLSTTKELCDQLQYYKNFRGSNGKSSTANGSSKNKEKEKSSKNKAKGKSSTKQKSKKKSSAKRRGNN